MVDRRQQKKKEFKNFLFVYFNGPVRCHKHFNWARVGNPGNTHDSMILQSTLYSGISDGSIFPSIAKDVGGTQVPPLIWGDSAF